MISKNKLVVDTAALASSDNVASYLRASDGTLLTHTDVGGKKSLDVNVANTVTVTATDLDIRNLSAAQDNVAISDGVDTLAINADGSINITDNGGSLTVDATDLDIRNLTHVSDSVRLGDGTNFLTSTTVASDVGLDVYLINASDIEVAINAEYAEDSAHVSGNEGAYVLSVREDTLASSTSISGDYQSFKTDALGRLWMNDTNQTMENSAVAVGAIATDLVATDLANRKRILVQNLGNRSIYIGKDNTVTTSNGAELFPGSSLELDIGPGVNIHAISASGTQDVRVLQLA